MRKILKLAVSGFAQYVGHVEQLYCEEYREEYNEMEPRESDLWTEMAVVVILLALVVVVNR